MTILATMFYMTILFSSATETYCFFFRAFYDVFNSFPGPNLILMPQLMLLRLTESKIGW